MFVNLALGEGIPYQAGFGLPRLRRLAGRPAAFGGPSLDASIVQNAVLECAGIGGTGRTTRRHSALSGAPLLGKTRLVCPDAGDAWWLSALCGQNRRSGAGSPLRLVPRLRRAPADREAAARGPHRNELCC